MDVSGNSGTPKSSVLIRVFHYFNHPFWGVFPLFLKTPKWFLGFWFGALLKELSTSCSRIDAYSSQGMPSDVRVEAEVCYLQFMAKRSKGFFVGIFCCLAKNGPICYKTVDFFRVCSRYDFFLTKFLHKQKHCWNGVFLFIMFLVLLRRFWPIWWKGLLNGKGVSWLNFQNILSHPVWWKTTDFDFMDYSSPIQKKDQ